MESEVADAGVPSPRPPTRTSASPPSYPAHLPGTGGAVLAAPGPLRRT